MVIGIFQEYANDSGLNFDARMWANTCKLAQMNPASHGNCAG